MSKDSKPTFNFHFHAPVGQNIANVEKMEVHFDKDMTMQVMDTSGEAKKAVEQGSTEEKASTTKRGGARRKNLFSNEESANEHAAMFIDYLRQHHMSSASIDTTKDNFITRALLSFIKEWKCHGIIDESSAVCGPACARFLKEHCHLPFSVVDADYGDYLTRVLSKKGTSIELLDDVNEFVRKRI